MSVFMHPSCTRFMVLYIGVFILGIESNVNKSHPDLSRVSLPPAFWKPVERGTQELLDHFENDLLAKERANGASKGPIGQVSAAWSNLFFSELELSKWLNLELKLHEIPWETGGSREGIPAFQMLHELFMAKSTDGLVLKSKNNDEIFGSGGSQGNSRAQGVQKETIVVSKGILCEKTQDDTTHLYPMNFAGDVENRAILYPFFVMVWAIENSQSWICKVFASGLMVLMARTFRQFGAINAAKSVLRIAERFGKGTQCVPCANTAFPWRILNSPTDFFSLFSPVEPAGLNYFDPKPMAKSKRIISEEKTGEGAGLLGMRTVIEKSEESVGSRSNPYLESNADSKMHWGWRFKTVRWDSVMAGEENDGQLEDINFDAGVSTSIAGSKATKQTNLSSSTSKGSVCGELGTAVSSYRRFQEETQNPGRFQRLVLNGDDEITSERGGANSAEITAEGDAKNSGTKPRESKSVSGHRWAEVTRKLLTTPMDREREMITAVENLLDMWQVFNIMDSDFEDFVLNGWAALWFRSLKEISIEFHATPLPVQAPTSVQDPTFVNKNVQTGRFAPGDAKLNLKAEAAFGKMDVKTCSAGGPEREKIFEIFDYCTKHDLLLPFEVSVGVLAQALGQFCPEAWTTAFLGFIEHVATIVLESRLANAYITYTAIEDHKNESEDANCESSAEIARKTIDVDFDIHRNVSMHWVSDAFRIPGKMVKRYRNPLFGETQGTDRDDNKDGVVNEATPGDSNDALKTRPQAHAVYRKWASFDLRRLLQILHEVLSSFNSRQLFRTRWPILAFAERLFELVTEKRVLVNGEGRSPRSPQGTRSEDGLYQLGSDRGRSKEANDRRAEDLASMHRDHDMHQVKDWTIFQQLESIVKDESLLDDLLEMVAEHNSFALKVERLLLMGQANEKRLKKILNKHRENG